MGKKMYFKHDFQVRKFRKLQKSTYNLTIKPVRVFVQSQKAYCSIIHLISNIIQGKEFLNFGVHFLLLSQLMDM